MTSWNWKKQLQGIRFNNDDGMLKVLDNKIGSLLEEDFQNIGFLECTNVLTSRKNNLKN